MVTKIDTDKMNAPSFFYWLSCGKVNLKETLDMEYKSKYTKNTVQPGS